MSFTLSINYFQLNILFSCFRCHCNPDMFRTASVEGSGPRTPPAYAPHPPHPHPYPPRFYPPRIRPPPPQYCFDAARFACDASKPRYLDVERERLVTRWLAEANEALVRRDRPPRYKPRSSERRPDYPERRPNAPEWADNFLLGRRNGSVEPEDDCSEVMTVKEFVDKFSLPRVVKFEGEERPVLLYRVLEAHRRVEAVPLSGKKGKLVGKPLYIPDSYDGKWLFKILKVKKLLLFDYYVDDVKGLKIVKN